MEQERANRLEAKASLGEQLGQLKALGAKQRSVNLGNLQAAVNFVPTSASQSYSASQVVTMNS